MKKLVVIATSLRPGSNSNMLAEQFAEGARAAGHLFCGGVGGPKEIEGNDKLREAYEFGKQV